MDGLATGDKMEEVQDDTDFLSRLSFEMLVRILRYLPVQSLLRLERLSRHLQKAVALHLQLVKSLDFTSDKWHGWMPETIDDEALHHLLSRCIDIEYIYGLHPKNLLLRQEDEKDSERKISIAGIINALQLCQHLIGVEISDIHLLEAILTELSNIEILGHFRNRNGCFPCSESSQLTLPTTSKLTCLHLYGILMPELPALNGLDELHLQFVKFSNPQPFQHFQSQWLLSFMMHNCIGPTNPLHYVPLLTALGNATHLRRLDLVRVPFLGGLLQHVVEDVWKKGGFSGVEKVRIGTCKNCFETDIGYLLLASEYWLEELSLQPSLSKDSFFWALKLAKVTFNMFETLELGYIHPSIKSGEWTNQRFVEHGLTDYTESPGLISDMGMKIVELVFNSVISLTIHNCPHLQNPLLWGEEEKKWEWLKSLHLDHCHSIQLDKFCQWLTNDLPVIHDIRIEHMFRAPPKGCSRVGLSAGTGLGVSSALVAPIGQTDAAPNSADNQEVSVNANQTVEVDEKINWDLQPETSTNSLNEKGCQSTSVQPPLHQLDTGPRYGKLPKDDSSEQSEARGSRHYESRKEDENKEISKPEAKDVKKSIKRKSGGSSSPSTPPAFLSKPPFCSPSLPQAVKPLPTSSTSLPSSEPLSSPSQSVPPSTSSQSALASSQSASSYSISSTSSSYRNSSSTDTLSSLLANPEPSSSVGQSSCANKNDESIKDSPSKKKRRHSQTDETNSAKTPATGSDLHQRSSSEHNTAMQNRCPTLEENFGLTSKAYVQECTYHDHSGQMMIRAVRTQSGQSSVIIPSSDLVGDPDVQPGSSALHADQLKSGERTTTVESTLKPDNSIEKDLDKTCSESCGKRKLPNEQCDLKNFSADNKNTKKRSFSSESAVTTCDAIFSNASEHTDNVLEENIDTSMDSTQEDSLPTTSTESKRQHLLDTKQSNQNKPFSTCDVKNSLTSKSTNASPTKKSQSDKKVSTKNQSTSTSDPVPEDDPVQVMVITSKTLEGLTLDSCGISHLHLTDCPQLQTLSGYDLQMLREVKMKNCPNLIRIDFSHVPCLSNAALLEPILWLPPTCSRFVNLRPLHMKSKSALESWLFAIDHHSYQLMYAIESKSSEPSIEGSVYMANWMDIAVWLNNYYVSTLTYCHDDDESNDKKKVRRRSQPRNIFITKCSAGNVKFKLSTDVPWMQTLSSDNGCQIQFGKPFPAVYPSERSDIVATFAKRCIEPLTHDMAEMRSIKADIKKCVMCIYIQVSDIQKN
ncbi:F-box only protein 38-like [Antedon mediterranea]|uniref:F-box only protein 38-like n=1 Tax=Antedon mediterranea TaxID=105859 RepID=UPI003AF7B227